MNTKSLKEYQLLLTLLGQPYGASISELTKALQKSPRTVHREIHAIRSIGYPIEEISDPDGQTSSMRWRIPTENETQLGNYIGSIPFLELEMRLAVSRVGRFETSETRPFSKIAKGKIASGFKDPIVGPASLGEKYFYSTQKGFKDYSGMESIVEDLIHCLTFSISAMVTYRSPKSDADKRFEIEPLTIVEHQNGLYLFAAVPKHERDIATLAIERIKEFEPQSNKHFERPATYSPKDHLSKTFGITKETPRPYRIKFDPPVAVFGTERVWAENQEILRHPDGSATLKFIAEGYQEIRSWVLGFGSLATVLEPMELADSIRHEAEAILQKPIPSEEDP